MRRPVSLLQALAHPDNQSILVVLAAEPSYARAISALVGLMEGEVTRRLRALEELGLVTSQWKNIGRNVKMYEATADAFTVRFDAEGMHVTLEGRAGRADQLVDPFEPRIPEVDALVGRDDLVAALAVDAPVVGLEGLAGIGKTSVLATAARQVDGAVFWHSFRGVESITWLLNRLAVFLASQGQNDLLATVQADAEVTDRRERLLATFDQPGLHYYLDDLHAIDDDAIAALVRDMAASASHCRLRLASRETLPLAPGSRAHVVGGLDDAAARALLEGDGVAASEDGAGLDRVGGHPLALHILADVARTKGVSIQQAVAGAPPGALLDFLLRELDEGLSDDERRILAHASLFRDGFDMDDLRALTQAKEATLHRLRRKHLVEAGSDGYIMHDLVRSYFVGLLDDPNGMHGRLADHYLESEELEGRIEAMHHLLEAGQRSRVLGLLEQNIDLRDFDLVGAGYTRLYEQVLSMFTEASVSSPKIWALIQDELGDIRFQEGRYEDALEHYGVADAYFQDHDAGTRDEDLAWKTAMCLVHLGRPEDAAERVDVALHTAPEGREKRRLEELQASLTRS